MLDARSSWPARPPVWAASRKRCYRPSAGAFAVEVGDLRGELLHGDLSADLHRGRQLACARTKVASVAHLRTAPRWAWSSTSYRSATPAGCMRAQASRAMKLRTATAANHGCRPAWGPPSPQGPVARAERADGRGVRSLVRQQPADCTNMTGPPRAAHRRLTASRAAGVAEIRWVCGRPVAVIRTGRAA